MMPIYFRRTSEPYGFLSNFARTSVKIDGATWPTTEHYFQAMKFYDTAKQEAIRLAPTPAAAKEIAWSSSTGLRADWNTVREAVMLVALRAKFTQHKELRVKLLATGDTQLVEHAAKDRYWGDGGDGSGQNRLGHLLMQVREELKQQTGATENRLILDWLFAENRIDLRKSSILDTPPPAVSARWERIEGMLLGLAVGDSLGNTSEAQNPTERRARYGEIRDYLPNKHADGARVGLPSDDSQLAFWTLEQINNDSALRPENLAQQFSRDRIFGIGSTMRAFLSSYKEQRLPWYESGQPRAGNGAIMRIAPVLIPHLRTPSPALWADTVLAAMLTHNDSASTAACVAFVAMLWELLDRSHVPHAAWWLDTYVSIAQELESGNPYTPRGGEYMDYSGPMWQYVAERVSDAYRRSVPILAACESWHSGAYLMETLPCALYILMRHGNDFEEAVVRAVNDTRDNDTVAALVGAALGALHGVLSIPARWRSGLRGRLRADDDGRLFALLDTTRTTWLSHAG